MKLTLEEFIAEQKKLIIAFELYWLHANIAAPKNFPLKMNDGDWNAQLQSFFESINK